MTSPHTYQARAIAIKQAKFGETDKIITLFTAESGKVRAIAKGACRPGSKLGGNVEPPNYSLVMLARGRNLDIITQVQTLEGFLELKGDLWRVSCAFYALELVDAFTVPGSPNPPLFDLLLDTLKRLCRSEQAETALRYFELQLLHHSGYRPQLQRCVVCNSPLKKRVNFFSSAQGGVLCPGCNREEFGSRPVSVDALKVLRLWQKCDYATASRVKLSSSLCSELRQLMPGYITYLLQKEVKSLVWLEEVGRSLALAGDVGQTKSAPKTTDREV